MKTTSLKLYCIFLFCSAGAYANVDKVSLQDYIQYVLRHSYQAEEIRSAKNVSSISLDNTLSDYEVQITPTASLQSGRFSSAQSLGVAISKRTELGPEVRLEMDYGKTLNPANLAFENRPRWSLTIEQGLFRNWGVDRASRPIRKAELDVEQNLTAVKSDSQLLIIRAAQTYFDLMFAARLVDISQTSVRNSEENLAISVSRYQVDLIPKTEIYRAELALLEAKDNLSRELQNYEVAKRQFYELANTASFAFRPEDSVNLITISLPPDPLSAALESRTDYRASMLNKQLAYLELLDAKANSLPDVRLVIEAEKGASFANNIDDQIGWNVGLRFQGTIGRTREQNQVLLSKNRYDRVVRDIAVLEKRIKSEILNSIERLKAERDRLSISERRREESVKAVELAKIRFERGLSSNLDLLDAERQLLQAQNSIIAQEIAINLATLQLAYVLGILDEEWLVNASN